jgi:hypothetical protein
MYEELVKSVNAAVAVFGEEVVSHLRTAFLHGVSSATMAISAGQENAQLAFDLGVKLTGVKITEAFNTGFNLDVRTNNEN